MSARAVQQVLQRCVAGPGTGDFFAVSRERLIGEPSAWRESMSFRSDGEQYYLRMRSIVDEPGTAIGVWRSRADPERVPAMAQAILAATGWGAPPSGDLPPGMDISAWTCLTAEGAVTAMAQSGSPDSRRMAPLDAELRKMAFDLQTRRAGSSLRVEARVGAGGVQVALLNDGVEPALLLNPFEPVEDGRSYLRLETAAIPEERPGFTARQPDFQPQSAPFSPVEPALWSSPYIVLQPGRPLLLRVAAGVAPGQVGRVVVSDYRALEEVAGVRVIKGRAFSNLLGLPS